MADTPTFDSPHAAALYAKLVARTARVGVIGLGYVGLPLAAAMGRAGFPVVGIDVSTEKCDAVNRGESQIKYVEGAAITDLVRDGQLVATTDPSTVESVDTMSICVPTPLRETKDPDLSYVVSAVEMVKKHLRPGMLIVLESTTYPGTTDELVRNALEETGLKAGHDFFLAYAPERVDPGLPDSVHRPRVVGGLTRDCSALAATLYGATVDLVVPVSSPRAAEMTKLLENTFRAINIGLANEMALICERMGVNVWEVIAAASTKPAGFMPFYPGPGLGGHCIPIDPFYLSWKVREVGFEARFIELAGHVNGAMPEHVVNIVVDGLNSSAKSVKDSNILVLGVAYKRDTDDFRESPALEVMAALQRRGARLSYHDPYVTSVKAAHWAGNREMSSVPLNQETLAAADCVVVLTDHSDFNSDEIVAHSKLVVDTRNVIKSEALHVLKLGAPIAL
jgi:UDP-N-acetyl-D-glucosamine dehydrogenase